MAAPTNTANVKKALANPEPSTHGPWIPAFAGMSGELYAAFAGLSEVTPNSSRISRIAASAPRMWSG